LDDRVDASAARGLRAMKLFRPLYERAMRWAAHPQAQHYLAVLSFIEAFIFPVAPEIMLAPMALAQPKRAYRYASISLAGSLLGSLVGYALGHYAFHWVQPLLADIHMLDKINAWIATMQAQMATHYLSMLAFLVLAALQPFVPMKVVTWASGVVGVPIAPFLGCVAVGRGKRVFLLAWLIRMGGTRVEDAMHRWIEWIGWAGIALLVGVSIYFKFIR
jgi:membrane protein YqaA with SNARE-associated domain